MEAGMSRADHLLELVSAYAKFIVNDFVKVDEDIMVEKVSDIVLLNHCGHSPFEVYTHDRDLLVKDVRSSIGLLLQKSDVIAREPGYKSRLISPYQKGTEKVVVGTGNMYVKNINIPAMPVTSGYNDPPWLINFKSI